MALVNKAKNKKSDSDILNNKSSCLFCISEQSDYDDSMMPLVCATVKSSLNTLVDSAIRWISENSSHYMCFGIKALKAQSHIRKISKLESLVDNDEKIRALDAFYRLFVNNLWAYENHLESVSGVRITSGHVDCYFVAYKDNGGRMYYLPLGSLSARLTPAMVQYVVEQFMEKCSADFIESNKKLLSSVTTKSAPTSLTGKAVSGFKKAMILIACFILAYIFWYGICYAFQRITMVEWGLYPHISQKTSSIFQTFACMVKNTYGINHNLNLGLIVFIVSLLVGVLSACSLRLLVRYVANFRRTSLRRRKGNAISQLETYFEDLYTKYNNPSILISRLKTEDILNTKIVRENNKKIHKYIRLARGSAPSAARTKKIPKLSRLYLYAVLAMLLIGFCSDSKLNSFQIQYADQVKSVSGIFRSSGLKADIAYATYSGADVLAKAAADGVVLCHMEPGTQFVLENEKKGVEGFTKIKLETEYGDIKGWVDSRYVEAYNPLEHGMSSVKPAVYDASSLDAEPGKYPADNLGDYKLSTSWRENVSGNGVGEYISLRLNDYASTVGTTADISVIGIGTGAGKNDEIYQKNGRPLKFDIEFYKESELVRTVEATLNDSRLMQYFVLSEPVTTDNIRFIIKEVTPGSENSDAFVSEILLYRK